MGLDDGNAQQVPATVYVNPLPTFWNSVAFQGDWAPMPEQMAWQQQPAMSDPRTCGLGLVRLADFHPTGKLRSPHPVAVEVEVEGEAAPQLHATTSVCSTLRAVS